jgi:hypothetical protein
MDLHNQIYNAHNMRVRQCGKIMLPQRGDNLLNDNHGPTLFLENGLLPASFLPGDSLLLLAGALIAKGVMDL